MALSWNLELEPIMSKILDLPLFKRSAIGTKTWHNNTCKSFKMYQLWLRYRKQTHQRAWSTKPTRFFITCIYKGTTANREEANPDNFIYRTINPCREQSKNNTWTFFDNSKISRANSTWFETPWTIVKQAEPRFEAYSFRILAFLSSWVLN